MGLVNALPTALLCGCAIHTVGFVQVEDGNPALLLPDGREPALALLDREAEPVRHLDGWMVEIDGHRRLASIRVRNWRALEGPHGMAAWVGPVSLYGKGVALLDRSSNALYLLDEKTAARLRGLPGALVAAEAWVVGPQSLEVVHYAVIAQ